MEIVKRHPGKLLCIIICLAMLTGHIYAQSYSFTHYQVENGLSNNTVLCSLQDKNGFMWFGTKDGLNRFDGYAFKNFRNITNDARSIGNNVIYCLYQDKAGILWVGTDRGIYHYNTSTESFSFFKQGSENEIRDIKADQNGNIWFIAGITLFQYQANSHKVINYGNTGINAVSLALANGTIWVSTTNRLIEKYNSRTRNFVSYDLFKHSKFATAYWIQKIADAGDHKLLIGTSNQGIKVFDTQTEDYQDLITYNADKTEIFARDFIRQSDQQYWIATESGIYIYDKVTNHIKLLYKQYNNPYSLSDNAIYTLCKDREGGIWAGTYFGGLNYYAQQYTYFEKYFPKVGENSLGGNAVREICSDKNGNLWIGTEDAGLNKFDPKSGRFVNFKPLGKPTDISTRNIHGLLSNNNTLLIGTFEHGLDVMNTKSFLVTNHYTVFTDRTLKSNFFYTLYQCKNGVIIASTSRGLYCYNPVLRKFKLLTQVPADLFYTSTLEDSRGTIWIGSYRAGLFYFNPKTNASGSYRYDTHNPSSLSNNKVNKIFEDSRHQLWVATENGLCRFNNNSKSFTRYTTDNGLPSNVIYAMLEDSKKNLWISTSRGLVCMNIASGKLKIYTKANGLLSDQFNYNSAYKDGQGNMYFGCVKGLIKFNPDNFADNTYQPPVYITGFQVHNKEVDIGYENSPLLRSVSFTDTIKLPYGQSSFSIDFAALSYTSSQTISYSYQLSGLDKDWIYLHHNRKVYFTRLSPGTYVFKVKASVNNSIWSKHEGKLTVVILPPFWQTTYAYLIYLALLALVGYFVINRYHRKTQEKNSRKIELLKNETEREIYQAKIAFFTHVAHEIRTPLTLIAGPMEKVIERASLIPEVRKNLAVMERNTQRLLALTNQLLDFRKTEINGFSLNFVKTDVVLLIKESVLCFEDAARQKKLNIKLRFAVPLFYAYVDAEALNKIISNLVDNAIKYSVSEIGVQLIVNDDNNSFTILMKNDGHKIPAAMREKVFESFFRMKETEKQSGTGIGLPLAKHLAELHNGMLSLQFAESDMNVFALTLPIHQDIEFNI